MPCARVLADVREALLDDPEDLDLLVGREHRAGVDLQVDVQCAVGRDELDVAAKRGVERRRPARRGEREHGELGLLLGLQRRRGRDRHVGAVPASSIVACVETAKVLREAVVDLPPPSPLLRDRPPELGESPRQTPTMSTP